MEIKQIKLSKMAVCCYLIGDETTRTCALIDPAFDTDRILSEAQRLHYRITHIINTHGHADVWPGHEYGPTPTSTVGHEQHTHPFVP